MTLIHFASGIAAYLIGGIPFGLLVAHWAAGIDIRTKGSGNIGATNVGRVLGFKFFVIVFLLDLLKGMLPVVAAINAQQHFSGSQAGLSPSLWHLPELVGLAAILGHLFPIYLGFKGGKGVATSIGVFLALCPIQTLIGLLVFLVLFLPTRIVAVGSLGFAAAFSVAHFVMTVDPWTNPMWSRSAFVVLAAVLIVVAHRGNISRLLAGTERRIGGNSSERKDDSNLSRSSDR